MESRRVVFETNEGRQYYEDDIRMLLQSNKPKEKTKLNKIIREIVWFDNVDALRYLLEKGYKIGKVGSSGETFLHLAFYKYAREILSLSKYWVPYVTEDVANIASLVGLTILHVACYSLDSQELIEKCLACNANVNAVWRSDPDEMERDGFTPLHFAAVNLEGTNFVKLLIEHNANVNAKDLRGRTPLHIACRVFEDPQTEVLGVHANFAEIMLNNNAHVNAKDNCGNTPLLSLFPDFYDTFTITQHSISKVPLKEIKLKMKVLLERGADVTARNNYGETILHLIIGNLCFLRGSNRFAKPSYDFDDSGHVEMIRQIFAACPDFNVNVRNSLDETPLELAKSYLSVDIVRILLDRNTDEFGNYLFFQNKNHFDYLDIVPRLEEVVNYIGIIELVEDKHNLTIDSNDKLIIMCYLIHDRNDCNCGYFAIKSNSSMVCNLLELVDFGSSSHLERVYEKLTNVETNPLAPDYQSQMFNLVMENLKIRKYANIYVDSTLPTRFLLNEQLNNPVSQDTLAQLDKELENMKSQKLSESVTLYDVMVKHPHNIYQYLNKVNLISIAEEYSLYKDIIKGHLTKSVVRNYVEKTTFESLQGLLPSSLPYLGCRTIMSYLSNRDMLNVFEAVMDE